MNKHVDIKADLRNKFHANCQYFTVPF